MTTLREAAQQALEALDSDNPDIQPLIAVALRAALAQEEQPNRAQRMRDAGYTRRPTLREMVEQEQEPVAWASWRELARIKDFDSTIYANGDFDGAVPLYTAPPRRPWQSLTEEEREQATGWSVEHIEAALEEKNNG